MRKLKKIIAWTILLPAFPFILLAAFVNVIFYSPKKEDGKVENEKCQENQ